MRTELQPLVEALADAHRTGTLLPTPENGAETIEEAYAIQAAAVAASGLAVGGWKIGCTSAASQRNLGSEGPIAGPMFATRIFDSEVTLRDVRMDMLLVEAEFAFRLAQDLPPRPTAYSDEEVKGAIGMLYPALELVQSRFAESRMPILGIVTDSAGAGSLILGEPVADWRNRDLAATAVTLSGPDGLIAAGHGSDVLGNPLNAMAWLANFLRERGFGLRAGDIVTTGTCFAPPKLEADIEVTADFGALGSARVRFEHVR